MKSTLCIAGLALALAACNSGGGGDAMVSGQTEADSAAATLQNIVSTSSEDAEPIMDLSTVSLPAPEDAEPATVF